MCKRLALVIALIIAFGIALPVIAADYATVRVLLTDFAASRRIDVGVYGSYSVDSIFTFQRGSDLVISSEQGSLIMYYEGMAYHAGDEIILRRHETAGSRENGLRLQGGLNLFEGDLHLSVQDGFVRPVLHIMTEDYLKGVVPYEMNDSFPIEALKAQAVAARTYALRNLDPSQFYDVVDNTNDQVYRGYDVSNVNAVRAIRETAGVSGMYAGAFALCYYTASNGGQTESPVNVWGGEPVPYLTIKEDPYDIENPESIVKRASVAKNPSDGVVGNSELTQVVKALLQPQLETLGYNPDLATFSILGIMDMQSAEPLYGDSSRVMRFVRMSLRLMAQKRHTVSVDPEVSIFSAAAPTQAPQGPVMPRWDAAREVTVPFTVDVPIFPDVESALQISINQKQNEILRVSDAGESFEVSMQRYGHGVGLSQRGAQQMAQKNDVTYQQILAFYYPGMELKTMETSLPLPTPVSSAFLATPGPVPTATPRPTLMPLTEKPGEGEWIAHVTGVAANSTLNLRALPDMTSDIIMQLYFGQEVLVLERLDSGWLRIKTDVIQGYVMERYVNIVK